MTKSCCWPKPRPLKPLIDPERITARTRYRSDARMYRRHTSTSISPPVEDQDNPARLAPAAHRRRPRPCVHANHLLAPCSCQKFPSCKKKGGGLAWELGVSPPPHLEEVISRQGFTHHHHGATTSWRNRASVGWFCRSSIVAGTRCRSAPDSRKISRWIKRGAAAPLMPS